MGVKTRILVSSSSDFEVSLSLLLSLFFEGVLWFVKPPFLVDCF